MQNINLPFFYLLGVNLNPLTRIDVGQTARVDMYLASYNARKYAESLLRTVPGLAVCSDAGVQLIDAIDKWVESLTAEKWEEEVDNTERYMMRGIVDLAHTFETVLSAELQTLAAFFVEQKGAYATAELIERAENVLPDSVKEKATPKIVGEIRESGRCLAFDNATASGFHIMRATEAVLHAYYVAVCEPTDPKTLNNWGAYIKALNACTDPDVQKVIAIVQQIKDQDRNLIMHPEVVLSLDEAFMLFEVAKGAIIAMAARLPESDSHAKEEA